MTSASALEAGGTVLGIVPSALSDRHSEIAVAKSRGTAVPKPSDVSKEGHGQRVLNAGDDYSGRLKTEIVGSMHEVSSAHSASYFYSPERGYLSAGVYLVAQRKA